MTSRFLAIRPRGLVAGLLIIALTAPTRAAEVLDCARPTRAVTLGTQPASFPDVMFSEVMRRDRILRAALCEAGLHLAEQPHSKGGDMLAPLARGELDGAFFGDMPMLTAASQSDIVVVGMIKQTFSSLVANRYMRLQDLKGRRIAHAHGSTAHYTLMQALRTAGLREQDVRLVPMELGRMPKALAAGEIDVFAAWEPAPTIALAEVKGAGVVYRGLNTAYFALTRAFVERHPQAARALAAALARAVRWMARSPRNLRGASQWALAAGSAYSGAKSPLSAEQAAAITRREVLAVDGVPLIPRRFLADDGILAKELRFLIEIGKLPGDSRWDKVKDSVDVDFLRDLLKAAKRWRIKDFDYDTP